VLAEFRSDYSHSFNDPAMNAILDDLKRQSPFFALIWKDHGVLDREGGIRTFTHPSRGELRFEQHTFRPSDRMDYKLVFLMPA
jgi:hypothetical protein